jgi:hypothetical protein
MARKPIASQTNGEATQRPPGRPSQYTTEVAAKICAEMAQGKSLRSIVEQPGMPDRMTVVRWLAANEDFRAQYTVAREIGLDHFAELTLAEAEADIPPEKVQAAKDTLNNNCYDFERGTIVPFRMKRTPRMLRRFISALVILMPFS